MPEAATRDAPLGEEDRLRADLYDFLGALLARPAGETLLAQTAGLRGDDATELGRAVRALSGLAAKADPAAVEHEFTQLFIGLGRGELLPYASYYLTGFLNEKPLAALRRDMAARGVTRAETVYEPEDNIASCMEMMGGLIRGRFGAPAPLGDQQTFFNRHIAPWARHFFADLEGARNAVLYASVGAVGRVFMEIEVQGFRLTAGQSRDATGGGQPATTRGGNH